jgi:hypothetical protein
MYAAGALLSLERELAGYASYEKKVLKRLIPLIW